MLTDARELTPGSTLEAEICVVGAGPAGLALALELARPGRSVLLLEAGGVEPEPDAVQDADAESVGESYFRVADTMVRAVGGTSNHWFQGEGFRTRPLDELDLRERASLPHSGWPMRRDALDGVYERAQRFLGFEPVGYELNDWADVVSDRLLALDPARARTVLFQVIEDVGMRQHLVEVQRSPLIQLVHHATVAHVSTSADGTRTESLTVRVPGGSELTARAVRFVLACGGIGNARLLLLSDDRHPAGLGNEHGVVGRYFMEHLGLRGATVRLAAPDGVDELALYRGMDAGTCRLHGKLSLPPETVEGEGLRNATFFLDHMTPARTSQAVRSFVVLRRALRWRPRPPRLGEHLRLAARGLPSIVRTAYRERRPGGPVAVQLHAMAEQAPHPASRVTLAQATDRFGLRRPRLAWHPTAADLDSIVRSEALLGEALADAGIGRLVDPLSAPQVRWQVSGQWHHMGTTRMHVDPTLGVVDPDGRVHGLENLWVTGASVFPTGGYANPTLTLVALALRLADHLEASA